MRGKLKPGYKQTEVGVIPEDWELRPLHALADKIMVGIASAATHAYRDRGIVMFRNQNIKPGYLDDSDILYIDPGYEATFKNKRLKAGDLLTARTRYPGTTGIVPPLYEGAQSFTTLITRPNRSLVDSRYLCCFINSSAGRVYFEQNQIGGGQKNVNAGSLKHLPVPFPPTKAEQEAIAEALSDADALIESLKQLIAKKRQIKQGAMQELLTGKKRLPGYSGEWEVKRLGDVLSRMANGAVYKPTNSFGLSITRIETISDGTIDYSRTGTAEASAEMENYKLVSGDILFSHINSLDHIGKVAQFLGERDLYHGMNLLLLRANKDANSRFLYFWFTSAPARRKARNLAKQAVSQASINTTELKALEILLPPVPEQTAIAAILSDMDVEIAALEEKLAKSRQLKQGMMQELLTGKTRLIENGKLKMESEK